MLFLHFFVHCWRSRYLLTKWCERCSGVPMCHFSEHSHTITPRTGLLHSAGGQPKASRPLMPAIRRRLNCSMPLLFPLWYSSGQFSFLMRPRENDSVDQYDIADFSNFHCQHVVLYLGHGLKAVHLWIQLSRWVFRNRLGCTLFNYRKLIHIKPDFKLEYFVFTNGLIRVLCFQSLCG